MESLSLTVVLLLMVVSSPCLATNNILGYRLITKDRPNGGIVEAYTQEFGWGLICTYYWNFELASAVCRHLNFPGTSRYLNAGNFAENGDEWALSVTGNVSIYYKECSIYEMNMRCGSFNGQDCTWNRIGAVTCKEPGYRGCFEDYGYFSLLYDRVFSNVSQNYNNLTIDLCINACKEKGFSFAGLEYAYECYCGSQDEKNDTTIKSDDECDSVCTGDHLESCGGSNSIAIYDVCLGVCKDPGTTPANGFIYGDALRYGSKVYFNCSDGFVLEGPDVIQCVKPNVTGEEGSQHAVQWNNRPPNCTDISSTVTPERGALSSSIPFLGTIEPVKQEGDQVIIYISIGIVFVIVLLIVIIAVVVIRKMHNNRQGKRIGSAAPTDNTVASRNDGNEGGSPLMPRRDEEDLFALSVLTSHSNTDGENHYVDGSEERQPTHPGLADRSANAREAFGYESVRLPSGNSALTMGAVPMGGATDLYANTDFHEVPSNLVDNELYG